MIITRWQSPYHRHGVRVDVPWLELADELTCHVIAEAKDAAPLWSPTDYPPQACRGAVNVRALSAIVLDYDAGTDPDAAAHRWRAVAHAVHSTWSYDGRLPKFRVVVPLAEPVDAARWARVLAWAWARSAPGYDERCRDPSRLYYVASVRAEDAPHFGWRHDGPLCRVPDALPPTREELELQRRRDRPQPPMPRGERLADARARREALNTDSALREAAGLALGGRVEGSYVRRVTCPSCGRPSVWWPLEPLGHPQAMCSHRRSCDWRGWLDRLLGERVREVV